MSIIEINVMLSLVSWLSIFEILSGHILLSYWYQLILGNHEFEYIYKGNCKQQSLICNDNKIYKIGKTNYAVHYWINQFKGNHFTQFMLILMKSISKTCMRHLLGVYNTSSHIYRVCGTLLKSDFAIWNRFYYLLNYSIKNIL